MSRNPACAAWIWVVLLLATASPARAAESARLTGRVIDSETLQPIAGAEVELANVASGQGFFRARTDRSGAFEMRGIAPNRHYGLTVSAPGYADFVLAGWQFPSPQRAAELEIPLDRAGSLEVKATRADGKTPIANAKVTLTAERASRWWEGYRPPPAPAFTDAKGVARFVDLEAGRWTLVVEYGDLVPSESRRLVVRRGETTSVTESLVRPASLRGTVRLPDGSGVTGVAVTAMGASEAVGTTGPEGDFSIEGLRPGRYRVQIAQEGFEPTRTRDSYALGEGDTREGLELPVTPRPPEVALVQEREVLTPSGPMRIGIRSFRVDSLDVSIHRIPIARLTDASRDFRELGRGADLAGLERVLRWTHVPIEGPPFTWREEQVTFPEKLPAGAYVVSARAGGLDRRALFFVTDLGLLVKRSPTRAFLAAASLTTGAPVSGAQVTVARLPGDPRRSQMDWGSAIRSAPSSGGRTDDRGMMELTIPRDFQHARIVAFSPAHGVSVAESPIATEAEQGGDRLYLYTERPIYRPGQTVFWKAFARRAAGNAYALPDAGSVKLEAYGPDGEPMDVPAKSLSSWGSADGSVELPPEIRLGDWRLSATFGRSRATATFAVQEYRKPEFQVTVTPDREIYVSGDEVRFVIAADYFFGAPVFGAAVRYNLFESKLAPTADEDYEARPETGYGRVLQTGEARTDIDGRLALTFQPARVAYDRRITLEVEVVDGSNRVVSGRGSAIIGRGLFTIQLRPVAAVVTAGEAIGIEVLTRDHQDRPVRAEVTVELDQEAWNPLLRRYVRSSRPLASTTATTDGNGRALVSLAPSPARAGHLMIRARGEDSKSNRIAAEASVWVYDARFADYEYRYPALEAFLDRERYQPGDTAHVLVNTDVRRAQVIATVEGRELHDFRAVTLSGQTGLISIPIRPEYAPNVFVSVNVHRGKDVQSRFLELRVAEPPHELAIGIEPDKREYRPGESARIRLRTTDRSGQPVRSELSLGVVDEAIYSLRADNTSHPHDVFYGRRPNWVTTAVSFPVLYYAGADKGREEDVRKNFRDVAHWAPSVRTDERGEAEVAFTWPDNLTTWRLTSRGMTETTLVGQAVAKTLVSKPLAARIALPRFLVAGDEAVFVSVVNNRTAEPIEDVRQSIQVTGGASASGPTSRTSDLSARGESRSMWTVRAARETKSDTTTVALTFRAESKVDSDALRVTTPILPLAVPILLRGAFAVDGAREERTIELPRDLVLQGSRVRIECAPTPAGMAAAALSYLADQPYGHTEQVANTVIAAVSLLDAARKVGRELPGWEQPRTRIAPLLARLVALQSQQGGWGWWREGDPDPFFTSLALDALARASTAGLLGPSEMEVMWQGAARMAPLLGGVRSLDGEAYVIAHLAPLLSLPDPAKRIDFLREQADDVAAALQTGPERLGSGGLALLVRAQAERGRDKEARAAWNVLEKRAVSTGSESHWPSEIPDEPWLDDETETTARALQAMLAVEPGNRRAPGIVRWLAARRGGGYWRSTRTTAPVAVALAAYLAARPGEMNPEYRLRVSWNGETILERQVTSKDVFGDRSLEVMLQGAKLRPGRNTLQVTKEGRGSAFVAWSARAMVPSPGPSPSGDPRLTVTREILQAERTTDRRGRPRYLSSPRQPGEPVEIGEALLVRLTLRSDRGVRWVAVEEPRPAGLEVSELLPAGAQWPYGTHAEQRDDRNVFFLEEVPKGETVIEYLARAEVGGAFTGLPVTAYAMYEPELLVRSGEERVRIEAP
jgi:uncharacterized protein YfaS (alpha-2-macroglobulin family)